MSGRRRTRAYAAAGARARGAACAAADGYAQSASNYGSLRARVVILAVHLAITLQRRSAWSDDTP
jgi:hypothetical protein